MTGHTGYASRRAFTILEGLTVAGVIMLLLSLAIVAATRAMRTARISSERHHISSIKIGLEQFKRDNGLPPLVADQAGPVIAASGQPQIFTAPDIAAWTGDPRDQYSIHSIPYYLMGLLDVEHDSKPTDGAAGPAITKLQGRGEFSRRGAPVPAVFTGGEDARRVYRDPADPVRIAYLDQWGARSGAPEEHAIRYYRWETNATTGNPNLPPVVGTSSNSAGAWVIENVELRSAKYALVSAGPDGLIDDANHDAPVNEDNIVEVGK